MENLALITGATSGIGFATAQLLARKKYNLILTGRREDRLKTLCSELENEFSIQATPLAFDISKKEQCQIVFNENKNIFEKLNVLINNAGLACGVDPMDEANMEDWENMIDTNVKGLLYVTRLALPFLKKQKTSHIINIGSVAGRWSYPNGGVYCSTKFAVRAISEGLRMDLQGTGARVTNISPGLVETEFSNVRLKDDQKAKAVYEGMTPLNASDIAECIEWSLHRPQHVNIQEMIVFPTEQASVRDVVRDS